MAPRFLEHLTITTGASRLSPRSEVSDETVAAIRAALSPIGGRLWAGWSVAMIPSPSGTYVYDLLHDRRRCVACWLCGARAADDGLWDLASRAGVLPGTRLHRPVHVPWLAVAVVPPVAVMTDPTAFTDVLMEAGDVERCVAWALLDR